MFTPFQRKILLTLFPSAILFLWLYVYYHSLVDPNVGYSWVSVWGGFSIILMPIISVVALVYLPLGIIFLTRALTEHKKDLLSYAIIFLVFGVVFAGITL